MRRGYAACGPPLVTVPDVPSTTRGSLPAGVYWRRRLAVLSLALVMVLAIGKVLAWSSDGSSADGARQAGSGTTGPSTDPTRTPGEESRTGKPGKGKRSKTPSPTVTPTPTPPPLPEPTGPCPDDDVLITPTVPAPVAGSDVTIVLNLQTGVTEACTWQVSADTVTLKITSGPDDIWSSRECPDVIPTADVVVRRAVAAQVPVVWNSRRSDEYCSNRTAWALPGFYHVAAAALSGEPTDVQFELTTPVAETVTQTADPQTQSDGRKGKGKNKGNNQNP